MRITGHPTNIIGRLQATRPAPATGRSTGGVSGDTVSLSPTGQLYMKAEQSLRDLPAVREGMVRGLQDQLATGGYQVNSDTVAAAILGLGKAGADD
jgi:negative regulator of flagellin synthesis FlgM